MRHALTRHPSSVSPANAIDAEITRTAESLALRFTVTGDIGQLAQERDSQGRWLPKASEIDLSNFDISDPEFWPRSRNALQSVPP